MIQYRKETNNDPFSEQLWDRWVRCLTNGGFKPNIRNEDMIILKLMELDEEDKEKKTFEGKTYF
jgi:hypothetical protein